MDGYRRGRGAAPLDRDLLEPLKHRFGFIFNSRAGNGRQASAVRQAARRLRESGHETAEFECTASPAQPAGNALRNGCDVLVACGGDGTVSGVAGCVLGTDAALGVLPLGTLNHFAKTLGIYGIDAAERTLAGGSTRSVDVATLNGRAFVNNSGIGIYPVVVLQRDGARKSGVPRWPAFLWACIKAVAKPPMVRLHLEADGARLARVTPFLFVGNNIYRTEGLSVGTRARLDEGLLGVCTARHHGRLGLFRLAARAIFGNIRQDRDFTVLTARELVVRTANKHVRVSLDGELWRIAPPLRYRISPGALKVLAP